ncbi:hypothetical protein, partial [Pantoea ananatis]|uniref:hypothetical protein n=1 Tax=Pantoea ananas TaxID=553 RepID=UPI001B315D53
TVPIVKSLITINAGNPTRGFGLAFFCFKRSTCLFRRSLVLSGTECLPDMTQNGLKVSFDQS